MPVDSEIKYVAMLTTALEKGSIKLRRRWMKVNKHLSGKYKTGKLLQRLIKIKMYASR